MADHANYYGGGVDLPPDVRTTPQTLRFAVPPNVKSFCAFRGSYKM